MMDNIQVGPAGGNGGKPFDHYDIPVNARLTTVHIYTEWVVNAVKFDFVTADGAPGGRPPIGGLGGEHHVFYLDEDEYLTGVSGRAGWYIDSLRFHTNKRVSPLFGGAGGDREFSFLTPPGSEVYGLFGRSDWYLDAIGISVRRRAAAVAESATSVGDKAGELDEEASWLQLAGEGQPVEAIVVVRRGAVASEEALDALEEAALAEAIAAIEGGEDGEGTVDVAVYSQVLDDQTSGETIAVVMAVATETDGLEVVGDELDEVAIMVTDTIESDADIDLLQEEAVEDAIDTLIEEAGDNLDEVEITIYSSAGEDEATGESFAAVVAIVTRAPDATDAGNRMRLPRPKDLERIEGIGPKIAELLVEHDIYDLGDLAAVPVDRLRAILGAAGRRFRLADPGSWPEQAALGAAGLWGALAELQARLKAAR